MMGYLISHLPSRGSVSRSVRTAWKGLDRRPLQDRGVLTEVKNLSVDDLPFLRTLGSMRYISGNCGDEVVSLFDMGEGAFVGIFRKETELFLFYYSPSLGFVKNVDSPFYTLDEGEAAPTFTAVPFNLYTDYEENVVSSSYRRKVLVYPACICFEIPSETDLSIRWERFNTEENPVPALDFATVHQGRVFGTKDGKFFASAWNDYTNWDLPTAEDVDVFHDTGAWVSATQTNAYAAGEFTAVITYDDHVIGFKRNYMQMIYGTKQPFRVVDVASVGALSQRAVCECDHVLYFVSENGVYAYAGGYPERISDPLCVYDFSGAMLACDDRHLFLLLGRHLTDRVVYILDTVSGAWTMTASLSLNHVTAVMSSTTQAVIGMGGDSTQGQLYYLLPGPSAPRYGAFSFTTDLSYVGELAEKRLKRLRLQVIHRNHSPMTPDFVEIFYSKNSGENMSLLKEFYPTEDGEYVISVQLRMTCGFGHRITVAGEGDFEIRYLQIDYEEGGQRYDRA